MSEYGTQLEEESPLEPPRWVSEIVGELPANGSAPGGVASVRCGPFSLVRARLPGISGRSADALSEATRDLYRQVLGVVRELGCAHPVRAWNFIPGILTEAGNGLNRYMAFNTGRFVAMRDWFSSCGGLERAVPTATGVGCDGDDLWLYLLAGERRGTPTENPRQRPAYRYSKEWGPLPPCFARATLIDLDGNRTLLCGGTSSVRGEKSAHGGDLRQQIEETFANLDELPVAAGLVDPKRDDTAAARTFREMRIYHPRPADADTIRQTTRSRYPGLRRIETVCVDLCRRELLVEIEAVADLDRGCPALTGYPSAEKKQKTTQE